MRKLAYFILLICIVSLSTACKDVCEKAADITENDCGIEPSGEGEEGEDVECEGETADLAQCAVDNKDAYCDFLDDPLNNAEDNAYADCIADVTGG